MKLIISANHEESCRMAAERICALVRQTPDVKLGLATGSTPEPVYQKLVEANRAGQVDFRRVRSVNLDEYCGLAPSHPQSYRYYMDSHLFSHIDIDKKNTYVAEGTIDPEKAAKALDQKVLEGGVPAFQLLGIGGNGHIAFNEAGDELFAASHVVELTESTIQANARFFDSPDEVPRRAITMGMKGILSAKEIWLLATGPSKKQAIHGLLANDVLTTQNPATFLKLHANVTVVIDRELASLAGVDESGYV